MLECVPYAESYHRGELVQVWNEVFCDEHNFTPLTRRIWHDRVERVDAGDGFENDMLRVAVLDGHVVGFAHGGIWSGRFLEHLLPESTASNVGHLSLIAVLPACRRQGIATALLESLRQTIDRRCGPGTPCIVDGRCYNPFYGNFFAPNPPLWGTTEGVAVATGNAAARGFFDRLEFTVRGQGKSVSLALADVDLPQLPTQGYDRLEVEIVTDEDYQAVLGSAGGSSFPVENSSRSWVAVAEMVQVGTLIGYPFNRERWAIFSLEVDENYRGHGIGRRLIHAAIRDLRDSGVTELEALVLPEESPGADYLYRSLGFEQTKGWLIYG